MIFGQADKLKFFNSQQATSATLIGQHKRHKKKDKRVSHYTRRVLGVEK